ncbi:iron ABC transporter permease [Bacillus sonorensis]|uniref:FecCD family ABC transporter permease n=1 Tax=Bacillus sonorensis TaxID=119858 RepID=UPI001F1E544F|nr:iron ABC transporter permease [Bacillus sonorensis]MCF7617641.1 iron ABC transporter permease [Bacillus sonorensis]MEC1502824.1 iron ABC transporter permease [Bacillus sonorensis]
MGVKHKRLFILYLVILALSCISLFYLSLSAGSPSASFSSVFRVLTRGGESDPLLYVSIMEIRMPRAIIAFFIGMMFALSGTILQDTFHNGLAGPELLGVSAGASLTMAVLTVLHLPVAFYLHPFISLAGGLAGGIVVILCTMGKANKQNMILIGAAVSAFFQSLIIITISIGSQNDIGLLFFYLIGSLANRNWDHVIEIASWFLVCVPAALAMAKPLNVLRLGDEAAQGRGVSVVRMRTFLLFLSVSLSAAGVAVCGPVGYIAFIAPHLARRIMGTSNTFVILPLSGLIGSCTLMGTDLSARMLFYPQELPVGLFTVMFGGLLLLFFLNKRRKSV